MSAPLRAELERCRAAEKQQSLYYRALAAQAEAAGDAELAARFHDLHADEQHHLSRLTARLLELGGHPEDLSAAPRPAAQTAAWEAVARQREREEIERYQALLQGELDDTTRALAREILEVERRHEEELGGKWTMA